MADTTSDDNQMVSESGENPNTCSRPAKSEFEHSQSIGTPGTTSHDNQMVSESGTNPTTSSRPTDWENISIYAIAELEMMKERIEHFLIENLEKFGRYLNLESKLNRKDNSTLSKEVAELVTALSDELEYENDDDEEEPYLSPLMSDPNELYDYWDISSGSLVWSPPSARSSTQNGGACRLKMETVSNVPHKTKLLHPNLGVILEEDDEEEDYDNFEDMESLQDLLMVHGSSSLQTLYDEEGKDDIDGEDFESLPGLTRAQGSSSLQTLSNMTLPTDDELVQCAKSASLETFVGGNPRLQDLDVEELSDKDEMIEESSAKDERESYSSSLVEQENPSAITDFAGTIASVIISGAIQSITTSPVTEGCLQCSSTTSSSGSSITLYEQPTLAKRTEDETADENMKSKSNPSTPLATTALANDLQSISDIAFQTSEGEGSGKSFLLEKHISSSGSSTENNRQSTFGGRANSAAATSTISAPAVSVSTSKQEERQAVTSGHRKSSSLPSFPLTDAPNHTCQKKKRVTFSSPLVTIGKEISCYKMRASKGIPSFQNPEKTLETEKLAHHTREDGITQKSTNSAHDSAIQSADGSTHSLSPQQSGDFRLLSTKPNPRLSNPQRANIRFDDLLQPAGSDSGAGNASSAQNSFPCCGSGLCRARSQCKTEMSTTSLVSSSGGEVSKKMSTMSPTEKTMVLPDRAPKRSAVIKNSTSSSKASPLPSKYKLKAKSCPEGSLLPSKFNSFAKSEPKTMATKQPKTNSLSMISLTGDQPTQSPRATEYAQTMPKTQSDVVCHQDTLSLPILPVTKASKTDTYDPKVTSGKKTSGYQKQKGTLVSTHDCEPSRTRSDPSRLPPLVPCNRFSSLPTLPTATPSDGYDVEAWPRPNYNQPRTAPRKNGLGSMPTSINRPTSSRPHGVKHRPADIEQAISTKQVSATKHGLTRSLPSLPRKCKSETMTNQLPPLATFSSLPKLKLTSDGEGYDAGAWIRNNRDCVKQITSGSKGDTSNSCSLSMSEAVSMVKSPIDEARADLQRKASTTSRRYSNRSVPVNDSVTGSTYGHATSVLPDIKSPQVLKHEASLPPVTSDRRKIRAKAAHQPKIRATQSDVTNGGLPQIKTSQIKIHRSLPNTF